MADLSKTADTTTAGDLLASWMERQVDADGLAWLEEQTASAAAGGPDWRLYTGFSAVPRHTGKADLALTDEDLKAAAGIRDGWQPQYWSVDEAARTRLLLAAAGRGEEAFVALVTRLFQAADVREAVALHQALPILPYPEALLRQAVDGLRTNMTSVFNALALRNPYPRDYFDERSWNQMVLKAVFLESPLYAIVGLDERANAELARMLVDYAHERWSAGRSVPPGLWRPVGPFAEGSMVDDLARVVAGETDAEREAGALALAASPDPEAERILREHAGLARAIEAGRLDWASWVARRTTAQPR